MDTEITDSIDFIVQLIEEVPQAELASRLTIISSDDPLSPPDPNLFETSNMTIIDVLDDNSFPDRMREEVYKFFPEAKIALLKKGAPFPFISHADDFNLHIIVHLRKQGLNPIPLLPIDPPSVGSKPVEKLDSKDKSEEEDNTDH